MFLSFSVNSCSLLKKKLDICTNRNLFYFFICHFVHISSTFHFDFIHISSTLSSFSFLFHCAHMIGGIVSPHSKPFIILFIFLLYFFHTSFTFPFIFHCAHEIGGIISPHSKPFTLFSPHQFSLWHFSVCSTQSTKRVYNILP